MTPLPIVNLQEARFECTFGRGCEGICCQNGRPGVYPEEKVKIQKNLKKFLPELRPEARKVVVKQGFLSKRTKGGLPMLRVVEGWCVFFHKGCVLHKVGAAEGDKYRYKPAPCALFPLTRHEDTWYIRQAGLEGEAWDLFCLKPTARTPLAREVLGEEIALAEKYRAEEASERSRRSPSPRKQGTP